MSDAEAIQRLKTGDIGGLEMLVACYLGYYYNGPWIFTLTVNP